MAVLHIPFQWSVHRQFSPTEPLEHFEFLADDDRDRREDFIRSLCNVLGRRGLIVVYNATFDRQRLRDLTDWFPDYGDKIANIQHRLWDLLPFVRKHIYHPNFQGSYSLKDVVPALVPELTYDCMDVTHGGRPECYGIG